ncbi:MAG: hypothetical protein IJS28_09695 [Synergistaceae bacterium]|nr:hypothetical protein [Synergistaceae bacterium]
MNVGNNNTINMVYNALTATNKAIEKTARALSTGQRTASASDNAAGMAIGMNISAQVAGVDRAIRNTQDGISLLQTAEGGLDQINSMLQRMRDLSVQAANDTLTSQDRSYIQNEIDELRKNIDNVASNTTFNSKRLLDGSSSAYWTSDDLSTKLKVSGALTRIDQFGQTQRVEGNYRIEIRAKAGQGEVQKSGIFTLSKTQPVKDASTYDYEIDINNGIDTLTGGASGSGWQFADGVLTITGAGKYSIIGDGTETDNRIVIREGIDAQVKLKDVNISSGTDSAFQITGSNVKVFLEGENVLEGGEAGLEVRNSLDGGRKASLEINSIEGLGSEEGTLTATGSGNGAGIGGASGEYTTGAITINGGTIIATGGGSAAGIGGGGSSENGSHANITINGGNITATGGGAGIGSGLDGPEDDSSVDRIIIAGGKITATGGDGSAAIGGGEGSNSGLIRIDHSAELHLSGWVDEENGETDPIGRGEGGAKTGSGSSALFNDVAYTGKTNPTLEDIPEFYTASGVFIVENPQKLTITQGNGKTAEITLYSQDTIEDVRKKLNDAIAFDLGQSTYTDNIDQFVSFVNYGENDSQGLESVAGTFVIRSVVAGNAGKLTIASDNHDLMQAFGLNTIQEATENVFTGSVYEAHTGRAIATNVEAQGNSFTGLISDNATIEFDTMAGVSARWDASTKRYVLSGSDIPYTTTLHIADRSTSFQVGQSQGEDIYLNIGDMRSESLGLNRVDVSTRENAAKSITTLDAAIHQVGKQRSKIGAYQNELEYNANSLTQTSLHMQESESRINDADMAKEYMEFVKLQILSQTGTSMLTQSQQSAQSLMNILAQ